jgi:frataxin
MEDSSFEKLAGQTLEYLFEALDDGIGDSAEVEMQGGILTVELADGGQYVINRHGPNRQIWVSSPKSGAWHFERRGDAWVSTRGDERLDALLGAEFGVALALD